MEILAAADFWEIKKNCFGNLELMNTGIFNANLKHLIQKSYSIGKTVISGLITP